MIFFTHSIIRRIFLYFLLLAVVATAAVYGLSWRFKMMLPWWFFLCAVVVFLILMMAVYWYEIVRPLKVILSEMKALLTGRPYRRFFTQRVDEIGVIAHFFNEVTSNFERISNQLREGKRMLSELEVAGQIQKDILPLESPQIPGLEVVAKTRPAVELGGDNFDFITQKENTYIYVGDVTGHGVPAAIIMTMVHTLIHTFVEFYDNAYDVVVQTNRRLKTRIKSTMFMTMLMLRWNQVTQKMTYVGAGHEHILIYRANKSECEVKTTGGIALGMIADNSKIVKELDLPLEKGDVIILYTDGVTEARNMAGEMYGLRRLQDAVKQFAPQYGPEGIVFHVARDFSRFVQDHVQEDDVTLIAIRYTGEMDTIPLVVKKSTQWADMVEEKALAPLADQPAQVS